MKILISDAFSSTFKEKLQFLGEVTTDKEKFSDADVVLVRSKTRINRDYIDNAPNLKLIIRGGVGLDNIDVDYAESKGIIVHNTPRASSIPVAELTIALMLNIPSRVNEAHQSMKQGKWIKKQLKRTELCCKMLCLVGMGNIAIEVAKRAKAFNMKVVAYRQSGKPSKYAEVKSSLKEAVKDADFISLHTPLTDSTRGMINKDLFSVMKKTAVVINTGRGACVNADDMAYALQKGDLKAYGTDVWPTDPPDQSYPLMGLPNVLMTPHIGASTIENLERMEKEIVTIIKNCTEEKQWKEN